MSNFKSRPVGFEPTTLDFGNLRSTTELKAFFNISSEWQDSNLRPRVPKTRALPNYATFRFALRQIISAILTASQN